MIIDQLPAALSVDPTDELPIEKGQLTYKATFSQIADKATENLANEVEGLKTSILQPSSSFPIPSTSVTKSMSGMTANHVLIAWNFSSSFENSPPCNLSWSTANGSFTITKLGGTTSESIQPVFALPTAVAAS